MVMFDELLKGPCNDVFEQPLSLKRFNLRSLNLRSEVCVTAALAARRRQRRLPGKGGVIC